VSSSSRAPVPRRGTAPPSAPHPPAKRLVADCCAWSLCHSNASKAASGADPGRAAQARPSGYGLRGLIDLGFESGDRRTCVPCCQHDNAAAPLDLRLLPLLINPYLRRTRIGVAFWRQMTADKATGGNPPPRTDLDAGSPLANDVSPPPTMASGAVASSPSRVRTGTRRLERSKLSPLTTCPGRECGHPV
jgi:hypothetical protein